MTTANAVTPPPGEQLPAKTAPQQLPTFAVGGRGLQIKSLDDLWRFSNAVSKSGLAPKGIQTPEAIFTAVQMGLEIGMSPMAALQNIAVINGRPGVYGDAGKALLRANGFDIEEMDTKAIKAKGEATCTITHPRQKAVTRTFSLEDAKTAHLWGKSGPWTDYPYRQMAWRAFWFAARDAAADMLKGVRGAEELRDYEEINVTERAAIPAPVALVEAGTPHVEPPAPVSTMADTMAKVWDAATAEERKTVFGESTLEQVQKFKDNDQLVLIENLAKLRKARLEADEKAKADAEADQQAKDAAQPKQDAKAPAPGKAADVEIDPDWFTSVDVKFTDIKAPAKPKQPYRISTEGHGVLKTWSEDHAKQVSEIMAAGKTASIWFIEKKSDDPKYPNAEQHLKLIRGE